VPEPHRSARLVAWGNAALAGRVSPDLAAMEVTDGDLPHRVDGLPGGGDQSVPLVLARLAADGVPGRLRLLLPASGDPVGLPGPGAFTDAALQAGEAVLVAARTPDGPVYGLVASVTPAQVRWQAYALSGSVGAPLVLPSLAESDRSLAEALREATEILAGLDLARWDAGSADDLAALRSGRLDGDGLAPGYPDRAVRVLVRARRLRTIVALAARADGAAVTAGEAAARISALRPLDQAARHAEMAAYNSVGEPGAGTGTHDGRR
jgi:hypothetical protein